MTIVGNTFIVRARARVTSILAGLVAVLMTTSSAGAAKLADIFNSGELAPLNMGPIGPASL